MTGHAGAIQVPAPTVWVDALCDKLVSNPSDQHWKDWISPDIPTKNHAEVSVDRTYRRVDRRHLTVLRPVSGGRFAITR